MLIRGWDIYGRGFWIDMADLAWQPSGRQRTQIPLRHRDGRRLEASNSRDMARSGGATTIHRDNIVMSSLKRARRATRSSTR